MSGKFDIDRNLYVGEKYRVRLLIYKWNAYLEYDICEICRERDIQYDCFSWKFVNKNEDEEFIKWFENSVDLRMYHAVMSINYWPLLSYACQSRGIKYIAWCYDNPLNVVRIEETLANPVNYVFLFDYIQYDRYKKAGFDTVYHLPLGVNRSRMERMRISESDHIRYDAQVALVGKLYESQLPEIMAPMNDCTKGFLNALMDMQARIFGNYLLDECISEELIQDINRQYRQKVPNTRVCLSKEALSYAMASEVTRRDRIILLSLCGKRFDTRLYSYQNSEIIRSVKKYPPVDYWNEMPRIFACTRINLNPSLRIIQTGIPLRALDIMGAGGFLLSNNQRELEQYYENEKEMVIYENLEDAIVKADFYLRHEQLREMIAVNGKRKTLEEHSIQKRMEKIFLTAEL